MTALQSGGLTTCGYSVGIDRSDLDLVGCQIHTARFAGARLTGHARFNWARFTKHIDYQAHRLQRGDLHWGEVCQGSWTVRWWFLRPRLR
jgi:hypothetical protein